MPPSREFVPQGASVHESDTHKLGWIGLGRVGYAMAERLAKAGYDIRGYKRTRAKAEARVETGVVLVDRAAELADCDIVFTMVSGADDLHAVAVGNDGLFASSERSPKILVELSTISAESSAEIPRLVATRVTQLLVVSAA